MSDSEGLRNMNKAEVEVYCRSMQQHTAGMLEVAMGLPRGIVAGTAPQAERLPRSLADQRRSAELENVMAKLSRDTDAATLLKKLNRENQGSECDTRERKREEIARRGLSLKLDKTTGFRVQSGRCSPVTS